MKNSSSVRKKTELRERFLRYAVEHAQNGRIPTVAEFRQVLGVSNYMLLNCMNELVKEGVIYRKSRKEGTFLSKGNTKSVVGLVIEQGRENEYVNTPSWLAGFCGEFSCQSDFLLRMIQIPADGDISAVIRGLGLDALVILAGGRCFTADEPHNCKVIHSLTGMTENYGIKLPSENTVSVDSEYWLREYVRSGVRLGRNNFVIISPDDASTSVMTDEIRKQGLVPDPECHLTDSKNLKKKLPALIKKYNINAVRCTGKYHSDFAAAVKKISGFCPIFPYFATETVYQKLKEDSNCQECYHIFEHLNDFYNRMGKITAQKTIEMVLSGKQFPSEKIKMEFSTQYQYLLNNLKGDEKWKKQNLPKSCCMTANQLSEQRKKSVVCL